VRGKASDLQTNLQHTVKHYIFAALNFTILECRHFAAFLIWRFPSILLFVKFATKVWCMRKISVLQHIHTEQYTHLSKDLFSVEKTISTEIAILLIDVDVLKEVTEEMRQTKCNPSLIWEQMLDVIADVAGKMKIRCLTMQLHISFQQRAASGYFIHHCRVGQTVSWNTVSAYWQFKNATSSMYFVSFVDISPFWNP